MRPLLLNCFEIVDPASLAWEVSLYRVRRTDGYDQTHENRADTKNAVWEAKKHPQSRCKGYGFVIDVSRDEVVVPANWSFPSGVVVGNYRITHEETRRANGGTRDRRDLAIVAGIIREGLKKHFKDNVSAELGDLWQDYDQFCQMPDVASKAEFLLCRKFQTPAKVLSGGRLVLQIAVSSTVIDGLTFKDYYLLGRVEELKERIDAKLANRTNRQNEPVSIKVWTDDSAQGLGRVMDLVDISGIRRDSGLAADEQAGHADGPVKCQPFKSPPRELPPAAVRLILDTQITGEEHAETILDPEERWELTEKVRRFVNGADVFGKTFSVAENAVSSAKFRATVLRLPALRVRHKKAETIIQTAEESSEQALKERGNKRAQAVRQHGFLQDRPIDPLLACPHEYGKIRAERLRSDLNSIWEKQGIPYSFGEPLLYKAVEEVRKAVEQMSKNALFVVLPADQNGANSSSDVHEEIKQRIQVPSQCVQQNHTLPAKWANVPADALKKMDWRLFSRVGRTYEICLANLLVKMNWVPFAPNEVFNYNVHVGLDVGGVHNNRVMACLGYGFRHPAEEIVFCPEEIPVDVGKAEPIPMESLKKGLMALFEFMKKELDSVGKKADFETVVFYRDGQFMGDGDAWNEQDALKALNKEFLERGWITPKAVWTAVEVMKRAEGWRLLDQTQPVTNPLVGHCVFPFEDDREGLICTTGKPYLSQGTACPLKIRIIDISGSAMPDEVARDLVWQADMCFTKMDQGLSLPWVLHVADTGALQASHSYRISGITA